MKKFCKIDNCGLEVHEYICDVHRIVHDAHIIEAEENPFPKKEEKKD